MHNMPQHDARMLSLLAHVAPHPSRHAACMAGLRSKLGEPGSSSISAEQRCLRCWADMELSGPRVEERYPRSVPAPCAPALPSALSTPEQHACACAAPSSIAMLPAACLCCAMQRCAACVPRLRACVPCHAGLLTSAGTTPSCPRLHEQMARRSGLCARERARTVIGTCPCETGEALT